jgi:hypothetical protein
MIKMPKRLMLIEDDGVILDRMTRRCPESVRVLYVSEEVLKGAEWNPQKGRFVVGGVGSLREKIEEVAKQGLDFIVCDGLNGLWEEVLEIAQKASVQFVLASGDNSYNSTAERRGIKTIPKESHFYDDVAQFYEG